MTLYINLHDQVKIRAKRRKITTCIKKGLRVALYGYVLTRVVMGGLDSIISYGKMTVAFKGIDMIVAKIIK